MVTDINDSSFWMEAHYFLEKIITYCAINGALPDAYNPDSKKDWDTATTVITC